MCLCVGSVLMGSRQPPLDEKKEEIALVSVLVTSRSLSAISDMQVTLAHSRNRLSSVNSDTINEHHRISVRQRDMMRERRGKKNKHKEWRGDSEKGDGLG